MKKILLLSLLSITVLACNTKNEIIKPRSTGRINNLLIVVDNEDWTGKIGDSLRATFAKDILGFPQGEPTFTLSQIALVNFAKILKPSRNILFVSYGKKKSFNVVTDKYATPQKIVSISAKNKEELVLHLIDKADEIIRIFKDSDFKIYEKTVLKNFWDIENIKTFNNLNANIKIPYEYRKVYDTLNYIWFRKEIPQGSLNLQMYAVPITTDEDLKGENIIINRNIKAKEYVVGSKEGMYMITEEAFTPLRFDTELVGKKTFETRGTWEMEGDFMAGPFLNYSVLDKKNNRVIVVEGFVYAPNFRKRDYMFELEILLKTLVIE